MPLNHGALVSNLHTKRSRMQSRDCIADIWGQRSPNEGEDRWPVRVDQRSLDEPERWVQSPT